MFNFIFSFSKSMTTFFRGHGQSDWQLLPGIGRPENIKFRPFEALTFRRYEAKGYMKLGKISNWEILFSMQHHGLPTRLLDWTDSLNVALFFAVKHFENFNRTEKKNLSLWVLDAMRLSEIVIGRRKLIIPSENDSFGYDCFLEMNGKTPADFPSDVIAMYPPKSNERLLVQGGMFTFHKKLEPLENIFPDLLLKIEIDKTQVASVKRHLYFNGVKESHLFPDLDGLAREIRAEVISAKPGQSLSTS